MVGVLPMVDDSTKEIENPDVGPLLAVEASCTFANSGSPSVLDIHTFPLTLILAELPLSDSIEHSLPE